MFFFWFIQLFDTDVDTFQYIRNYIRLMNKMKHFTHEKIFKMVNE